MPLAASLMRVSPVNQKASSGKLPGKLMGRMSSNTPALGIRVHMLLPGTLELFALDRQRSRTRPWVSWYQAAKKPLAGVGAPWSTA